MVVKDEKIVITPGSIAKWISLGFIGLLALIAVFGSFYTVGPGERGIVLTWGAAEPMASEPGLNFKIPIAQGVVLMTVQTQKYETDASAASKDLQVVSAKIAVNYHLNPEGAVELFKEIGAGYQERVMQPAVQEAVKAATAQYTAEELITKRALVKDNIQTTLSERMGLRGIIVEDVSIVNFDFSSQFNEAIELKVTAEQNALTEQNKLKTIEFQAQQRVAQANGERDATIAVAQGQAQSIELTARAEAEKIRLQNQELAKSPQYVELVKWQKWNGALPTWYMTGDTGNSMLMQVPSPAQAE